jgi:hypothetical protein
MRNKVDKNKIMPKKVRPKWAFEAWMTYYRVSDTVAPNIQNAFPFYKKQ